MLVCAYCGKKIGNNKNSIMEFFGLWNHIKNKHWKEMKEMEAFPIVV